MRTCGSATPAPPGQVRSLRAFQRHRGRGLGHPVAERDLGAEALAVQLAELLGTVGAPDLRSGEGHEVVLVHVGMRQETVDDRRHRPERGDALGADPLRDADRVDAIHGHAAGAHLERLERGERHHVQDGERQDHPEPRVRAVVTHRGVDGTHQHQVVLAVHDALGEPGGATGVRDRRRRVRVDLDDGRVVGGHLTEQGGPLTGRVLGVDGDEPAAAEVAQLIGHRGIGERDARFGVAEQVRLLRRRQRAVDAEPDGAETHGTEARHDDVGVVRQRRGHAVAGAHPEPSQHRGRACGGVVEVAVRVAREAADECLGIGTLPERALEDVSNRERLHLHPHFEICACYR